MTEVQRLDNLVWEILRYARPHEPDLRPTSLQDVSSACGRCFVSKRTVVA